MDFGKEHIIEIRQIRTRKTFHVKILSCLATEKVSRDDSHHYDWKAANRKNGAVKQGTEAVVPGYPEAAVSGFLHGAVDGDVCRA